MGDNDLGSGPSAFELHKFQVDWQKFQAELRNSSWRAAYEGANAAGRTALNSLLLASGGAVVALLAFLGNLLSRDTSRDYIAQTRVSGIVHGVTTALGPFVLSMFLAIVAAAITYLSMFYFSGAAREDKPTTVARYDRVGTILNICAVCVGIVSLGEFGYGAFIGLHMLKQLG